MGAAGQTTSVVPLKEMYVSLLLNYFYLFFVQINICIIAIKKKHNMNTQEQKNALNPPRTPLARQYPKISVWGLASTDLDHHLGVLSPHTRVHWGEGNL